LDDAFRSGTAPSFSTFGPQNPINSNNGKQEHLYYERSVDKQIASSASTSAATTPFPGSARTTFEWGEMKAALPSFPTSM